MKNLILNKKRREFIRKRMNVKFNYSDFPIVDYYQDKDIQINLNENIT